MAENSLTSALRPAPHIQRVKEFEIFRDNRNAYKLQIFYIEGHLYIGLTLFYFDISKCGWYPTRKNFNFPAHIWSSFIDSLPEVNEALKDVLTAETSKGGADTNSGHELDGQHALITHNTTSTTNDTNTTTTSTNSTNSVFGGLILGNSSIKRPNRPSPLSCASNNKIGRFDDAEADGGNSNSSSGVSSNGQQ